MINATDIYFKESHYLTSPLDTSHRLIQLMNQAFNHPISCIVQHCLHVDNGKIKRVIISIKQSNYLTQKQSIRLVHVRI